MKKKLTLLQINDLHGYLEPHSEMIRVNGQAVYRTLGGLAQIATAFAQIRQETGGAVVALDNGDTFHGTYAAVSSKGEVMIPLMNALDRYQMLHCSMDDLLLDAIAAAAGVEIAFSNGWRYGAPIPVGPITLNDLWNMIPTNPMVSTVEVSGAEMRSMLEENLERTFAADPYAQMGGFVKRCRGLHLFIKIENPCGNRIDRLFAEGLPIDPTRIYKVAFARRRVCRVNSAATVLQPR